MLKVGITGGIGSGKTTVCKVFQLLGVPVFNADQVAKSIMVTDRVLVAGIKSAFGDASYFEDGTLNNKHLANIVFEDTAELTKLNALVHPAVFRAFDAWILEVPAGTTYILKEAALLFESESYKMCDLSILVIAPDALKYQRVMQRDGISAGQVKSRMDKQFTDEAKLLQADITLLNDEEHSIIEQVLKLHEKFSAQ